MIDKLDRQLKAWISETIKQDTDISFAPPSLSSDKTIVSAYLYKLDNSLANSTARNIPFQITLCYLITVQSNNPIESHKLLGELLLAANERSDINIDLSGFNADFWQSLNMPPQPHFVMKIPLTLTEQSNETPAIIKEPTIVDLGFIKNIKGLLLGPDKQPISGAKITSTSTNATVLTNNNGIFSITTGAKELKTFNCLIHTKGQQFSLSVPIKAEQNSPITIHLDTLEV